MKKMMYISRILIAIAICLIIVQPVSAQLNMTLINLGTLGGIGSLPRDINNQGKVVGFSLNAYGGWLPFIWTLEDGMVNLGTSSGSAYDINELGQVVGDSGSHGFIWTEENGMKDLGTLGGYSKAIAINDLGQVVGDSSTALGENHAFIWTLENGMKDLGTLGGSYSTAVAINNLGQVVGYSSTALDEVHAFIWTVENGMKDLGTLDGSNSKAFAINNLGQVVGNSGSFAFIWTEENGMVNLGTLDGHYTTAVAINDQGQVVGNSGSQIYLWTEKHGMIGLGSLGGGYSGYNHTKLLNNLGQVIGDSSTLSGEIHAFIWTEEDGMVDLGTLGGSWSSACAINDKGQVAGYSRNASGYRPAVLWSPKAPIVYPIISPIDPIIINTEIVANASFIDYDTADTHTAEWDWGDGTTSPGTVTEEDVYGSVEDSHIYISPGLYTITLTVIDNDGEVGIAHSSHYVVVYDPDGGFVTGGGWINSPEGAYTKDLTLSGRAIFGFHSKYLDGANVPTGETDFRFEIANNFAEMRFYSDDYDWLVIAGARAKYKGTGTIDGEGNYGFMLSAIDGDIPGGGGFDKFRIKIWEMNNDDAIVYDNEISMEDNEDPTTKVQEGSIIIHKEK